jgi:hypothetical protein
MASDIAKGEAANIVLFNELAARVPGVTARLNRLAEEILMKQTEGSPGRW